jgi:hypothetical protein
MCQNPLQSPSSPDYSGAANAQGQANIQAAIQQGIMGNPNISGPAGGQTVTFDPITHQPTINQNLSPGEQNIFNLNENARAGMGQLANQGVNNASQALGSPFQFSGTPQQSLDLSGVAKMPVNAGQTGQNAIMSRLQPQIEMQRNQLQTQLANQGLSPGGEAYNNAMRIENQQENDLQTQAALQGLGLDFQANQQGFGQALQSGQFGNTAQAQALQQALTQRELPLNEVSGLMSGSQVSMPAFQGYQGAQVQPAPVMQGATNQGNYNAGIYNSQMQGLYGGLGLGMGVLGAGIFSDRRLKSKIRKVGVHKSGLSIYEYEIFGRKETGMMADEVERIRPEAVYNHPSGYKMVRYAYLA